MSRGILSWGDFVLGGILSRGILSGGFCPGGFVRGDFVLIPKIFAPELSKNLSEFENVVGMPFKFGLRKSKDVKVLPN